MHTIDVAEVAARDAYVRWSIDPASVSGCWAVGSSVALLHDREPRPGLGSPWLMVLGKLDEARALFDALADLGVGVPAGVTVSAPTYPLVPTQWALEPRGHWDYLVTSAAAARDPGRDVEVEVLDVADPVVAGQVDAVLDADNDGAFARPGDADVHTWMGVRDGNELAAAGALCRTESGAGHLRAITTLSRARGRGYGAAVSAALTRRGLDQLAPEVTLGVYSDNAGAIRLYERLGYRLVHHFVSAATATPGDVRDVCM